MEMGQFGKCLKMVSCWNKKWSMSRSHNAWGLLGHVEKQCKKKQSQQQVWKPKVKQPEVPVKTPEVSHDEEIHSERDLWLRQK